MSGSDQQAFEVVRGGAADLAPAGLGGAVLAIGNFDGVHRGHRAVLDVAVRRARSLGRPAAALTFEPHPRIFFRPDVPLFRLSDAPAKLRLLAGTALDGAIVATFDAAMAAIPAESFVTDMLLGRFAIAGAVIGFDFHFGKGRGGSPDFLVAAGQHHGFTVDVVPALRDGDRAVSSGLIRDALAAGRISEATALLGQPWFVSGTVIHGEKRGRDLGFPTANLRLAPDCGLRHGIYAVRVGIGCARYDGVASFGRRPTFDNGAPLLEVFLFDFQGDLYGREIDVAFVAWIREELRFDGIEPLKRQMADDVAQARNALALDPESFPRLGTI